MLLPVSSAAGNSSKIGMVKSFVKRYVPGKRNAVHTDGPSYAGDAVLLWGFLGLAQDVGRVESPISSVPPLLL